MMPDMIVEKKSVLDILYLLYLYLPSSFKEAPEKVYIL